MNSVTTLSLPLSLHSTTLSVFSDLHFCREIPHWIYREFCLFGHSHSFSGGTQCTVFKNTKNGDGTVPLCHLGPNVPFTFIANVIADEYGLSISLFVYFEHLIRVSNLMVLSHFEFVVGTLPI